MESVQGVKRPHPQNEDAQSDSAKRSFLSLNSSGVSDNSGTAEFGEEFLEKRVGRGEFVRRGGREFGESGSRGRGVFQDKGRVSGDKESFGRGRGFRDEGGFSRGREFDEKGSFVRGRGIEGEGGFDRDRESGDKESFVRGREFDEKGSFVRGLRGEGGLYRDRESGDEGSFGRGIGFRGEAGFGRGREFGDKGSFGMGRGLGGKGGRGMREQGGFGQGLIGNMRQADDFSTKDGKICVSNGSSSSKVYPDFPDWSADKIHDVLEKIHIVRSPHAEPDKTIWNTLVKEVNPTLRSVLHYCKKMLYIITKKVEVEGLPQEPGSFADTIKEKANLWHYQDNEIYSIFCNTMRPSERCQYYVHHWEKKKDIELMWFNYYKKKPEDFQELCKVSALDKFRDFELNS
ncbi:Protein of unknown function [Gryllus bimaculatus]|nr:Protein of unknown function [Gryllus bimaculatus]